MNNIHLYIGNTEVEFATTPEILYTYQVDDLTNPTVVKNSFSKSITVKGTKSNNHLFGHYWNVERVQVGSTINASKKVEFNLYVGSELYESGYAKLDEVRRVDNDYEYDITLFGGLGDFFHNLSVTDNGDQRRLADLDFNRDLDFTINLNTVKEAWNALKNNTNNKWQTINFMPAYNGIPEDFDSKRMLMDISATNLAKSKTEDGKTYKPKENWVMAELPDEMTEWETRDLRSYLQRPAIRMKEIIKACCNSDNNGGYTVELDNDFFNENNPYWENTWMTLPMIQALEYDSGEQTIQGSKLIAGTTTGNTEGYMYQPLNFDMGEFPSTVVSSLKLSASIDCDLGYSNTSYIWFWNWNGDSYHTGWACFGSLYCQLLAFNGDTVVGASNVYNLTTPIRHNGNLYYGHNDRYSGGHQFTPYMNKSVTNVLGTFKSGGFTKENESSPVVLNFTINGMSTNVTALKMCYYWGASKDKINKFDYAYSCFDTTYSDGWVTYDVSCTSTSKPADMEMDLKSSNLKAVLGGTIGRTGTEVTKNLMLNTEASPCDYLLSYCKMFGLYFSKSPYEKRISIQTRKTFYDRGTVTDISKDIDYSKSVTITPIAFGSKWVEFNQEQDETQYSKDYQTTKGLTYGSKVLNTGYEFDSEKKQLLDGNVLKSAIEGLERSKYFTCYNNDTKVRPFFGYGMKYSLYNGDDSIEVIGTNSIGSNLLGINEDSNLKYYDLFPKIQLHDRENKPTDGNNCLVFFSGFKNLKENRANPVTYILSDDSYYQSQLNEGTPCWLFVGGDKTVNDKQIASVLTEIPVFERYLTDVNGTTVKKSLDFGTAQELYIPKYSITEDVNIYSSFWKSYLEDLYDINTKILTVYVRLKDKVGYDLLRQFYWFENAIWRINKITDWNIGVEDVTKVEFVKVQDMTDYTSVTQTKKNTIKLSASKYNVSANGDSLTLSLTTENGGSWRLTTSDPSLILSTTQGTGNMNITLTVPQTKSPTAPSYYTVTAIDNEGNTNTVSLTQSYNGETQFSLSPKSLIADGNGRKYYIEFYWVNQGDNEITNTSVRGDVNATVELQPYSAYINVTESNEPDAIISGKVLFSNGLYSGEVGIDQMPQSLSFGKDGGEYEFIYNYNTNVTYTNLPSWVIMEGNKLTVLPNYYEVERAAKITVSNYYSLGEVGIVQAAGNAPSGGSKGVTPTSMYFNPDGDAQYLNIQIPNTWRLTRSSTWIKTNIDNGNGETIVAVSCDGNTRIQREGSIFVKDVVTGVEYEVTITQDGGEVQKSLSVSPTDIICDYEGGIYYVGLYYGNRNGDYVDIEGEGLTWTNMVWDGDGATLKVTVPVNETTEEKTYTLTFKTPIGNISINIEQGANVPTLSVNKKNINVDEDGGNVSVNVKSNIYWFAQTSDSWISISPTTGDAGTTEMNVMIDENAGTSNRTGYVYIFNGEGDTMATITVTQEKFVEQLVISPSAIEYDQDGGNATITITSNTAWTIELI